MSIVSASTATGCPRLGSVEIYRWLLRVHIRAHANTSPGGLARRLLDGVAYGADRRPPILAFDHDLTARPAAEAKQRGGPQHRGARRRDPLRQQRRDLVRIRSLRGAAHD